MSKRIVNGAIPLIISLILGCGSRHSQAPSSFITDDRDSSVAGACTDVSDCPAGTCENGTCVDIIEDAPCQNDGDCEGEQYCHYPSGITFNETTTGLCDDLCQSPRDCFIGQECIDGHCFSNYDCDPSQHSCDCPPSEVCNGQTRSCNALPSTCYFNEQCPCSWLCNSSNICINPNELGICSQNADCNSIAGCEQDRCTCENGSCRPSNACTSSADCPTHEYCSAGVCLPAPPCNPLEGDEQCSPYNLVCNEESNHCTDPEPCVNGTCPPDYICRNTTNPPSCFPEGAGDCSLDSQCPIEEYCELFSNTCIPGCRNNADCVDQCSGATTCNCNQQHQCVRHDVEAVGAPCHINDECPGGTICAYNEPTAGLTCGAGFPIGDCSMSCRQVCDILTSQIIETCPAGQICGGDEGLLGSLIAQLFGNMLGDDSNTSVCY